MKDKHEPQDLPESFDATTDRDVATRIRPRPSAATAPGVVSVGTLLKDRFHIESEIARGGMGIVYRARDRRREQFQDRHPHIAIKVLSEECKSHPDSLIAMQREAGKVQKLAHPNIVTVYDFDVDGDTVFMTMEYLQGESLDRYLARTPAGATPRDTALSIVVQIARGLAYAHEKGIVHCDLKPANVFLTDEGTVKILDFGIARAAKRPEQTQSDATRFDAGALGALTPAYASCELIEHRPPDPRDDIYALACVAYELLSGRHPFNKLRATDARDNGLEPAPIKGLSASQWKTLRSGLAFDRKARPTSAQAFLSALKDDGRRASATPRWLKIGTAGALMALLAVSIYLLIASVGTPSRDDAIPTLTAPPIPAPRNDLTVTEQEMIDRLLEAADIHFQVGRIVEPEGSNAYAAYQKVLAIDAGNVAAHEGMGKIADHYAAQAWHSLQTNDATLAAQHVADGLRVQPYHTELNRLQKQLDN